MTIEAMSYTALEVDVMRGGLAVALLLSLEALRMYPPPAELGAPVGIERFVDLRWFRSRRRWLDHGAYLAVAAYAIDRVVPLALGYLGIFLVTQVTIRQSRQVANHGDHLVTIVVLAQLAAVFVWNASAQWGWDAGAYLAGTRSSTMIWWSVQAILAIYFTAGISKLVKTGGGWIFRSPGLLVAATSRLETGGAMLVGGKLRLVPRAERLIGRMLQRPALTRLVFAGGLVAELLAPLGLLNPNALVVVGIALLLLHQANGWLLLLPFPNWQVVVFVYLVNVPRLLS